MENIKRIYGEKYGKDDRKLEGDIKRETCFHFKRLLLAVMKGSRERRLGDVDDNTRVARQLHERGGNSLYFGSFSYFFLN